MIDNTGEYVCGVSQDAHWILEGELSQRSTSCLDESKRSRIPILSATKKLRNKPVHSFFIDTETTDVNQAVPQFLHQFKDLKRIVLPSQISAALTSTMIPSSVKELEFFGRHDRRYWKDKTVVLGEDEPFTGIESLGGESLCYRTETRFKFNPDLFPNLTAIGFTFDRKRKFEEVLSRLNNLTAVSAAAFDSVKQLADLLPIQNIISLTLAWNQKIEDLQGIEAFTNLRYLKLTSLTRLRTLEAVNSLRQLEHIGIYWSKRIEDTTALLKLPRLKTISSFGNDHYRPVWKDLDDKAKDVGISVNGFFRREV